MDLNFNKNEDHNKLLLSDLRQKFAKIKLGGGEKRIQKLHTEGKMTARERIDYLLDAKAESIEIGAFVGDGMYISFIVIMVVVSHIVVVKVSVRTTSVVPS